MPKIPIDFTLGQYSGPERFLSGRDIYNCYPSTDLAAEGKNILKTAENYSILGKSASPVGLPDDAIMFGSVALVIANGVLYQSTYASGFSTWTSIGVLDATPTGNNFKMVGNGQNVVIYDKGTSGAAWYYDGTLAMMSTLPNFSSFGTVIDVTYHDGYYVFITTSNIFHGDNAATGTGLAFNALSFSAIPEGTGRAIVSANGYVYAITNEKTFLYATAPTAPFSFASASSQDIDLGCATKANAVEYKNRIYAVTDASATDRNIVEVSGTSTRIISNGGISHTVFQWAKEYSLKMSGFSANGHEFIQFSGSPMRSGGVTEAIVYDITESDKQGRPIWHKRGLYDGSGGFDHYPIIAHLSRTGVSALNDNDVYSLAVIADQTDSAICNRSPFSAIDPNEYAFPAANHFDDTTTTENGFQYTFPFIRAEGDPVSIKSVLLRFADYVTNVTLSVSEDGVNYTDLGTFDLTSVDSKTAEWRRLGRFNNDCQFRVFWQTEAFSSFGNRPASIIEGYFLT